MHKRAVCLTARRHVSHISTQTHIHADTWKHAVHTATCSSALFTRLVTHVARSVSHCLVSCSLVLRTGWSETKPPPGLSETIERSRWWVAVGLSALGKSCSSASRNGFVNIYWELRRLRESNWGEYRMRWLEFWCRANWVEALDLRVYDVYWFFFLRSVESVRCAEFCLSISY